MSMPSAISFYSNGLAADVLSAAGTITILIPAPFNTASLNLEEGKPYVIYAQLGTKLLARYGVVCTEKIIIDKTAPAITGAKNGDVFCGEGDKTLTVTDLYLDTVTVNGKPVTPNEAGRDHPRRRENPADRRRHGQGGQFHDAHRDRPFVPFHKWQTENGQYWGGCEFCGDKVEKTGRPPS